jgi:DNA mismatch endonuclease, patch repair protein
VTANRSNRSGTGETPGIASPRTVSLGGGRTVPYPEPSTPAATQIGRANRRRDTKPEVELRAALHRLGLRFRKDLLIRCGGVRVRPDVVFTRWKLVVFVDGCFWHGCPDHGSVPKTNREYWVPKLRANVERDVRASEALTAAGWSVLRFWEHEDVEEAAGAVRSAIDQRRASTSAGT